MGIIPSSRFNMTDDQIWRGIVDDCHNTNQKSINVGSSLRRKAIIEMDRRLKKEKPEEVSPQV